LRKDGEKTVRAGQQPNGVMTETEALPERSRWIRSVEAPMS